MKLKSLVLAAAAVLCALPSGAIDIIDLHANTSTGIPTMLGQVVTVNGVVTVPGGVYSDYSLEVYVQDATAGVNVYVYGGLSTLDAALGDSVTVTGPVAQYNGLTELGTAIEDMTWVNHGPAVNFPDTLIMTCAQVLGAFQGDYSEPDESRLIRINDVSVVDGSWPTVPGGGNSYIDINDGTGELLCFIDVDCEVNGSPEPDGTFDIVGMLKQYDNESPYTEGYQIQPRFLSDVIDDVPGPPILGTPYVRNVTETSADIFFTTSSVGSSEVEYGLDDSYGSTAGDAGASETEHEVALDGLSASTVYHFRVKTTDETGTNYGADQRLVTSNSIPGQVHVYMSYTTDESYATGDPVSDNQDFSYLVCSMINQATYSVDACLYSFSLDNVKDALIAAHQRGCQVRIIIDADNSAAAAAECASYGIPYIISTFAGNHGADDGYGCMHNKWITIDAFDANVNNDWVWTGSGNMSISGLNDVNNGLRIKDFGLAQAYTFEFDEMWGNHGPGPNPTQSKMGSNKTDDTPHEFTITGIRFEQYMSPSDQTRYHINQAIGSADHSIYFAILAFPDWQIANAMLDRRYEVPDLQICGVFNDDQGPCEDGSQYYDMVGDPCTPYAWDPPADVWIDTYLPSSRLLHHKYIIVDVNNDSDDPLVSTGSHNFSWSADNINDENTLIIHDGPIANLYLQEFAERYFESGGTADLGTVTAVDEFEPGLDGRLIANLSSYPNPFNPFTNVSFQTTAMARVTVRIFDPSGRQVRSLAEDQLMESGLHVLGWDGRNDSGRRLSSGVYLARVEGAGLEDGQLEQSQAKLILVQ